MEYVILSPVVREVSVCEQHKQAAMLHPDRVMSDHDLIYVVSGEWTICQNDRRYTVRQGECLLLAAGEHHYGRVLSTQDCETIYIHFSQAAGDRLTSDEQSIPSGEGLIIPTHGVFPAGMPLYAMFRQVVDAYWSRDVYAGLQSQAYLMILLTELAKAAGGLKTPVSKQEQLRKIIMILDTNSERFFTSEELASYIGVSSRTLLKYFRETLGMSVRQYQLWAKLEKARFILQEEPHIPLAELAQRLGFCDEYHFSKQFKRRYGYPPKHGK